MVKHTADKVIVVLDYSKLDEANSLLKELGGQVEIFKVGLEMAAAIGWERAVKLVKRYGKKVFVDCKVNDIPNTMASAVKIIAKLQPYFITVDAAAGTESLKAAVANKGKAKILAVTVPTAMDDAECKRIYGRSVKDQVLKFSLLAANAGCDGVICATSELEPLNKHPKTKKLLKVTPGIRPAWADANDQKRTMTPRQAMAAGADYLVIGRPITRPSKDMGTPLRALEAILQEIA